jgi:hypothetical protein
MVFKSYLVATRELLGQDTDDEPLPKEDIPIPSRLFYHDFGHLIHPRTGAEVQDLTDYQYKIWDDPSKYRMVIKSQKVGLSTTSLLEDFQKALTTCKGKDILLIAQTQYHANEHLLTLKTHIINSEKYRKYLMRDPSELLFKEEKTKVKVAYIKNPDNPLRPSRIIGLGMSEGAIWSWKNIGHIHMSDPTASEIKDDAPLFAATFSRLANTSGTMLIETPPRGPRGKVFEIYQQSLLEEQSHPDKIPEEGKFKIFHVTAGDAVHAGLITEQFLNEEKRRLGALYPQYYESAFIAVSGNLYNQASIDKAVSLNYEVNNFNPNTEKYIVADQGYVTSKFAILIAEFHAREKRIRILLAEELEMPTYDQMINRLLRYRKEYGNIQNIGIDATSRMEFAMSLKEKIGESNSWPFIKDRMAQAKNKGLDVAKMMTVVPIIFSTESKAFMSSHSRRVLDDPRQLIAIDPRFISLITGLRSAVFDDKGQLDKELTPHDDLVDCFQMLTTFFHFKT